MTDELTRDIDRNGGAGSLAASYARAQLVCREVREDLVALQRDELSPLRAESVRSHLASCPECREEALELELAMRSYARLPEPVPPVDLVDLALRRVNEVYGPDGSRRPVRVRARPESRADAGHEPARARRTGALFRPVRSPIVWLAAGAFYLFVALSFAVEDIGDAVGRAQLRLLGPGLSEKLERVTEAILLKL